MMFMMFLFHQLCWHLLGQWMELSNSVIEFCSSSRSRSTFQHLKQLAQVSGPGVFKPPSTMGSTSTTKTAMEEGFQRWLDRRSEDHFDGGTQVSTGYERDTMSNLRYPVISQSLGSNQTTRLGSSGLISSLGLELARPSVHRQVRASQSLHLI